MKQDEQGENRQTKSTVISQNKWKDAQSYESSGKGKNQIMFKSHVTTLKLWKNENKREKFQVWKSHGYKVILTAAERTDEMKTDQVQ